MSVPMKEQAKAVKEHLSRSRGYLGRHELIKGLASACDAVTGLVKGQIFGTEKFQIETLLRECLATLQSFPEVKKVFPKGIEYKKGGEKGVLQSLVGLYRALTVEAQRQAEEAKNKLEARKKHLFESARSLCAANDFQGANKVFRALSEEFKGDTEILAEIGTILVEFKHPTDAVTYLEMAIEQEAKTKKAYPALIEAFRQLGERKKAEAVYIKVLRQFGRHPKTYVNMARLYMEDREWTKAYEAAKQAMDMDSGCEEAKEIVKHLESKYF